MSVFDLSPQQCKLTALAGSSQKAFELLTLREA